MKTRDWWLDFFDDGYRFLYSALLDGGRTEEEVAGLVKLLKLQEGARVLDLCCGDGRHAVPLFRRGLRVVGVDTSRVLLQRGRERARKLVPEDPDTGEPLEAGSGPSFVEADARALPLRACFDAAILLFNSIGYGTDEDTFAMFREARRALVEGGALVVECSSRDSLVRLAQLERATSQAAPGGVPVSIEHWVEPVEGLQHAVFRWTQDGVAQKKHLKHRMYTPSELKAMLLRAGFGRVSVYGGFDKRLLYVDSPEMVLHAR